MGLSPATQIPHALWARSMDPLPLVPAHHLCATHPIPPPHSHDLKNTHSIFKIQSKVPMIWEAFYAHFLTLHLTPWEWIISSYCPTGFCADVSQTGSVLGWIVFLLQSCIESWFSVSQGVTPFWDRLFIEVIKLKGHLRWAVIQYDSYIYKRNKLEHKNVQKKNCVKTLRWPCIIQGARPYKKPKILSTPWSQASLHNSEKINFGCLSHPVNGTLSWQPYAN